MTNVFDYLLWRGDLKLDTVPFNDVDALILSRLSYIPFDGIVPEDFAKDAVLLKEAAKTCLAMAEKAPAGKQVFRMEDDPRLLSALLESPRFSDMRLTGYVNRFDPEKEKQFSAITVILEPDKTNFVAYRGTDGTLVGWKEDFNMGYQSAVPAQLDAVDYLEGVAKALPGTLRIGGHSKGGNLAVYAAAFSLETVQARILDVYNNDGPGFDTAVTQQAGFARIIGRVHTFVPQGSIIGQLLLHEETSAVIHSTNLGGLLQHDLYSWEIRRDGFVKAEELTNSSKVIDRTLKDWFTQMSPEMRGRMIDGVYSVLSATGAVTLSELAHGKNAMAAVKALREMDEPTRKVIQEAMERLAESFKKAVPTVFETAGDKKTRIVPELDESR